MPDVTADLRNRLGAVAIHRDVVVVRGPEAVGYLQGQLSQDVAALAEGASAWSLLLQPTGKVDAWLRATRLADDEVLLDVEAGAGAALLARLQRFKLRTRADLEEATWSGWAVRGPGATSVTVATCRALPAGWPGVEGVDVLGPDGAEAPEVGVAEAPLDALEVLRVEAGVPSLGAEITEATIPAELGQWLIDASVSFTKGCYTGQELVARIDSRGGKVPRPVRGVVVDGDVPQPGAAVRKDGAVVGTVTSSARSTDLGAIVLAPLARSVEPGDGVEVDGPNGPQAAEVRELPLR